MNLPQFSRPTIQVHSKQDFSQFTFTGLYPADLRVTQRARAQSRYQSFHGGLMQCSHLCEMLKYNSIMQEAST